MEDDLPYIISASYFDPEKRYYYGDVVLYDGSTYFANEDVIEEYPDISSSWTKCTISGWMNGRRFDDLSSEFSRLYSPSYSSNQNYIYTTTANTSISESRQIEMLQAEINKLKLEVAEIRKELRLVKTHEEAEHRKLGV